MATTAASYQNGTTAASYQNGTSNANTTTAAGTTHNTAATSYATVLATVDLAEEMEPYFYASVPCFFLSLVAALLNLFVIDYYWRSRRSFVPLLYILISAVDVLTAVGVAHQSVATALYTRDHITERTLDHNSVISYTLTSLCYKSSIFYNVVLAVSRTVVILRPFHIIKVKVVTVVCVVYGLVWAGLAGYDIYYSYFYYQDFSVIVYYYYPVMGAELLYSMENVYKVPYAAQVFMTVVLMVVPYLLPVLLTLITCILQVWSLHSPNLVTNNNQRHVTVTILLMSALFVVCNSAFSCYILYYKYAIMEKGAYGEDDPFVSFSVTFGTVLPILNAALNPVIIIARSKGLREGFVARVKKIAKRKVGNFDKDRRETMRMSVYVNDCNATIYNNDCNATIYHNECNDTIYNDECNNARIGSATTICSGLPDVAE